MYHFACAIPTYNYDEPSPHRVLKRVGVEQPDTVPAQKLLAAK